MNSNQENSPSSTSLIFPEGFLWGAATSHFQYEGNPYEIANRISDWSLWTEDQSHINDQSSADHACEFYQRFQTDLDLLDELNLNAFRIGLNWAAICPQVNSATGTPVINKEALNFYRQVLIKAKEKNVKTFVTLFHFSLPVWLAETGGWANEKTAYEFSKFAQLACRELGDLVDFWLTINEPSVYTYYGYINGQWPPGLTNQYPLAFVVIRNLLVGHAAAYRAIHDVNPAAQVSYVMHWRQFMPRRALNPLDVLVAHSRDVIFNHLFPTAVQTGHLRVSFPFNLYSDSNPLRNLLKSAPMEKEVEIQLKKLAGPITDLRDSADFLGINYYTRDICEFSSTAPFIPFGIRSNIENLSANALGWENYPAGLLKLLTVDTVPYHKNSKRIKRPIYITENGYASRFSSDLSDGDWSLDDHDRCDYLRSHLISIYKAIKSGINIKGYLHWSLLDNFEWAEGLQIRFGLVRIAYPTQARTLRNSARIYARIASDNGLLDLIQ